MAPKGRKSITPWFTCETCQVVLTQRHLSVHQESGCPPSFEKWAHGFIKDKVLYSSLEEFKSLDAVKTLPQKELNNLVFLSQNALQLCEMCIGDPVLVTVTGVSTVKLAWPTTEHTLVSVLLTKEAISGTWNSSHGHVIVSKLPSQPLPAQEVHVNPTARWKLPEDLSGQLGHRYNDHILLPGEKVTLPHYGRSLTFKIDKVIPYDDPHIKPSADGVQDLSQDLNSLTISGFPARSKLYKILEATKWVVVGKKHKEGTKGSKEELSSIGGLDQVISELREVIGLALNNTSLVQGLRIARGVLIHGPPGTGKTQLCNALAAECGASLVSISGPEVYGKFLGEAEGRLRSLFEAARVSAPSIVLLDCVDSLCPAAGSEQERRVASALATSLDSLHSACSSIAVLATTSSLDRLDPVLRRPGRLDREVEVVVPSPKARFAILEKLLAKAPHDLAPDEVQAVADSAHGYVGADLSSLCSRAAMRAAARGSGKLALPDLQWGLTQVKPSAMREVLIEVPDVRWNDIGGQHELKLKLRQAVEWPLKHPESFARLGIPPPRGVLMFGPPGCSKTMIAKALATESKLNFLSIKGPELFSKWVGESERAVRQVFQRARQVAPSVVFFDELDALGGERGPTGSQGSNVQERVLAQLLTELDGVEPLGNVTVVGATNRPDRIDKALLRPGRLDRIVYVPLPDPGTRREIFQLQLKKTPVGSDVNLEELVEKTEGYSGAEVLAICHEAALKALEEDLAATAVSRAHFLVALGIVTPRTPPSLLQLYENYLKM